MVELFADGISNLLVTFKRVASNNYEWVCLSSDDHQWAADIDPITVQSSLQEVFPGIRKPFFEGIYEAFKLRKNICTTLVWKQGIEVTTQIQGHIILQADGSELITSAFLVMDGDSPALRRHDVPEDIDNGFLESGQLYQSIAKNFPRGTIDVLDTSLRYIYTEGTEYRLLDLEPAELVGTSHLDLYDAKYRAVSQRNLEQVLEGQMVTYEVQYRKQFYLKSGVPLRNEKGKIDRILLVQQNITGSKKLEAEREILIKDLKSHNEELLRFAYIVSHNLRAPIVNISLLLDLFNETNPADPENEEVIENLKISTNLLHATLQDLIEVVSIKKQKIPKVEVVNFNLLLNNVEKSLFNQLKESGIKIHKDFSSLNEMNYIYAHLENFFMNFLTNSVKYRHPDRTPEVWISTYKLEEYRIIEYKDNGIGLDLKRYGDRLFGLYQRFHNHVEGKGLGLYLVREQIRANDGKIETESSVGDGLLFRIYLRNLIL
ncbi:sensor histidine kinase [Lunatibacter salilacus]|uniref:sensor histidine kinase n=1 Tax=Lunatibacter salilacus TaxID=2483804 RepID=UPI00131C5C8C|nr:PAS domain-containing sensor histidine kinase [Lunatibacter salilacus]